MTIIRKNQHLSYYPIEHIDAPALSLIEEHLRQVVGTSFTADTTPKLLNAFLGLTKQNLTLLGLSNSATVTIFESFLYSIKSGRLIELSPVSIKNYLSVINRLFNSISKQIPMLKGRTLNLNADRSISFCSEMEEYYMGWYVVSKGGEIAFLQLPNFWKRYGSDKAKSIFITAKEEISREASLSNKIPILNGFLQYMDEHSNITLNEFGDFASVDKLIKGYCRHFFTRYADTGQCITTARKRWNDAYVFMNRVLFENGVLCKHYQGFPYITPKRKTGNEHNVKLDDQGNQVKEKLLTNVPLQITDNEAISFVFHKIKQDIQFVVNWAEFCVENQWERFVSNKHLINHELFGKHSTMVLSHFGYTSKKVGRVTELAESFGLPNTYTLDPFIYLLINEHPEITERYLLCLELYNKHGRLVGIEKTDAGIWLVGYKPRKGSSLSQQKILLNKKSESLFNKILRITEPLRKNLQELGDDNYKYLFLTCGRGFEKPRRIMILKSSKYKIKQGHLKRQEQFANYTDCPQDHIKVLDENLTPSKFRASRGVQVYLETRSVKAMSDALGHAKYKPDLLSHYLPEPILQFFQTRWIRLFQKGIVCEAMKDSPHLFQATQFETMEELDQFLANHAIKHFPETNNNSAKKPQSNIDSVLISVDKKTLSILLSLDEAVKNAVGEVSSKAIYWAEFARSVVKEIDENSHDHALKESLKFARQNIREELVKGVLHA